VFPGVRRPSTVDTPVRELQTTTLHFGGLPLELYGVIYGPVPSPIFPFAAFGGSLLIDAATSSGILGGTISPTGASDLQVQMPALPAAVLGVTMHVQSVFFDGALSYVVLG